MTDNERRLLELAAKASGIEIEWNVMINPHSPFLAPKTQQERNWLGHDHTPWNPLVDDGDALRLLVRLRLTVNLTECRCCAGIYANQLDGDDNCPDVSVRHSPDFDDAETTDPYAATRLAIVRAAAEIGKSMEVKL